MNQRQKQIFKTRANNIIGNSKEDFKKINVNLELQSAFALSATFARNELTFINSFKKFPLMNYFVQDPYRWNILNYIIYFSAKKEPKEFYSHNILKYKKFINIIKRFNFK